MQASTILRSLIAATLALLCVGAIVGCSKYGRTSEQGYKYATALYSVCNLEDAQRLEKLQEMVAADLESGAITTQEARWIESVVEHAADGDWETAKRKSRKLMEDQLERD